MWVVLLLCVLLCLVLGTFVLAPLVGANETLASTALKGFADENELRQALRLRDALLEKCAFGTTDEKAVEALSEKETLDALVTLCERLRNAELPYLPERIERSSVTKSITLLLILFGTLGASLAPQSPGLSQALAQALPPAAEAPSEQATDLDARIPPAVSVEGGFLFPTLHQFVLSPRQGRLHAYYLGLINNLEGVPEGKIALPLPQGFEELKILNLPQGVVSPSGRSWPAVSTPMRPGVMEIRAEFSIKAPFGKAVWENPEIPALPGTLLFLMPEYDSALRSLTENVFPELNLWPPRLVSTPNDFRSIRTQDEYDPADPNYGLLSKMPPAYTRNMVRTANEPAAYPQFRVTGLTPTRAPLFALGALFGAFLAGAGVYALTRKGSLSKA